MEDLQKKIRRALEDGNALEEGGGPIARLSFEPWLRVGHSPTGSFLIAPWLVLTSPHAATLIFHPSFVFLFLFFSLRLLSRFVQSSSKSVQMSQPTNGLRRHRGRKGRSRHAGEGQGTNA